MKSILKSLKFMALFTGFFLYCVVCVATFCFGVFAPFGAVMLSIEMGLHPAAGCVGGFLVVFSYILVAEKLGHLDDLHL